MLKLFRSAALAATLSLAPAAAFVGVPNAVSAPNPAPLAATVAAPTQSAAVRPTVARPAEPEFDLHSHDHDSGLAPGQTAADFRTWLARSPVHRAKVAAFESRLRAEGVDNIVPVWQLVRTSSSWRSCGAEPFEVAPADKWENIVKTLKFVRDEVVPAIGPVEPLSAYRNEGLNACSAGAPKSAHRMFFALDLTPVSAGVSRETMIRRVCAAHAEDGRAYDTGLGFYSGKRFHVDSSGFRKWGPNGRGATSPCVA